MINDEFKKELQHLINRYSIENGSNTPDFLLADYLVTCLENFNNISKQREQWYGTSLIPGTKTPSIPDSVYAEADDFRKNVLRTINTGLSTDPIELANPFSQQLEIALPITNEELIECKQYERSKNFFDGVKVGKSKLLFYTVRNINKSTVVIKECWDHDISTILAKHDLEKIINKVPVFRTRIKSQFKN